ncbi:MAG: 4-alpha-glucanotransferase [Clostridia bacterium]|nr:4-alpha-glucanotransferase [Clostridia bacterium]
MKRQSGVLMHISELPGEYSCGSFGREAREFVDLISDMGFSVWQVLPFGLTDAFNSPYTSYSAFGGNPYFIDLPTLFEANLITRDELDTARQKTPYVCEYKRLYDERYALLLKASRRVKDRGAVESFISERPELEEFCRFMTNKNLNSEAPWWEWKPEQTSDDRDSELLFMWKFIQYEFFRQWNELHGYCAKKGVRVIGDMPIYVSLDSCDVWAHREQFLLDRDNKPQFVAGVPPDYFAKDGQLWGNPLYDWEHMKLDGYSWWTARMTMALEMFDGVRIDHFRALSSYWAVPGTAKTAREGEWRKGPGREFIDKLNSLKGDGRLIIAEDLGDIDEAVYELVEYSGFPGMRVFQFGFFGDADSPHRPHSYVNNCVAYTGTHDNNTLLGFVWEMPDDQKSFMLDYCFYDGADRNGCCPNIIKMMFASQAGLVVMPVQDLLGFGSDTRLNRPGVAAGNWEFRTTREQLAGIDRARFARLNELYSRR